MMNEKNMEWHWEDNYKSNFAESNNYRFVYSFNMDNDTGKIVREDSSGNLKQLWEHQEALVYSASILIDNDKLYVGLFSRTSSGCRVLALELSSGNINWDKPVLGLGPIGHSRYNNKVQLRIIENQLIVFGWESDGKYIEILELETGKLISNRKLLI